MHRHLMVIPAALVFVATSTLAAAAGAYGLDPTFSGDGIAQAPKAIAGVSTFDDVDLVGSGILATGVASGRVVLVRYTGSGSVDTTFGVNGIVTIPRPLVGRAMVFARTAAFPDGSLVVVATSSGKRESPYAVVRLDANGVVDPTFGQAGVVSTGGEHMFQTINVFVDSAQKIVVVGSSTNSRTSALAHTFVRRLTAAGKPDTTFHGTGTLVFRTRPSAGWGTAAVDGKTMVLALSAFAPTAAGSHNGTEVFRIRANGAVRKIHAESPFRDTGSVPVGVALDSQRRILVGFTSATDGRGGVVRLTASGRLDPTYGSNGRSIITGPKRDAMTAFTVMPNGVAMMVGTSDIYTLPKTWTARWTPGGKPDTRYGPGGMRIFDWFRRQREQPWALIPAAHGDVLIAGFHHRGTRSGGFVARMSAG